MEEDKNTTVGNWAWLILFVALMGFILYGLFFTPKAYGESVTLEQALLVGGLPWCDIKEEGGFQDFSRKGKLNNVRAVELTSDIRKKVFLYVLNHHSKIDAEVFLNSLAIIAVMWDSEEDYKRYHGDTTIFYIPVNKDTKGRWCSDFPQVANSALLPDDEVKALLAKKRAEKRK